MVTVLAEEDDARLAGTRGSKGRVGRRVAREAGVVEGRVVTVRDIEALATMPSKEEIYSKLLYLLSAPSQRLVTVMNAVGRNLAVVIDQGVQEKKFKEA